MSALPFKEWWTALDLALAKLPELPQHKRLVNLRAEEERWAPARPRIGRGGGVEYHWTALPPRARAHLEQQLADVVERPAEARANWSAYEAASWAAKDEAQRRAKLLHEIRWSIEEGVSRSVAVAAAAERSGVDRATLYRWQERVRGFRHDDWCAALVPNYRTTPQKAECSDEAWEAFKADYLRLEQPAAEPCYRRLERLAEANEWTIPSLDTLMRRLKREVRREVQVLARKGSEAFERTVPQQRRDRTVFRALEAVNADGHEFDVFVRWPDGVVRRPLGVFWQDLFSAKMLSWRVDYVESKHSVRLAFGDLVEKYGIPEHAYLDNGRAFASKWLTGGAPNRYRFKVKDEDPAGLLVTLGTQVHWVTPYHGQAKPIERAFRDFAENVAKHPAFAGAYTGNNPTAKPENYGSAAVPLETFLAVLEQEVAEHNAREGRRSAVCAGRSLDEAFNASYAKGPVRQASADQRRLWLLAAESVRAGREDGAVRLMENTYHCEALQQLAGETVVARFDPTRLHGSVHVYTLGGDYVGEAACVKAVGFADAEAARELAKARATRRRTAKDALEATLSMSALEVAARLPPVTTAPTPMPEVVHLTRPRLLAKKPERKVSPVDPAALEAGAAVLMDLEARRRERAEQEREEEELFTRVAQLAEREHAGDDLLLEERALLNRALADASIRARLEFEREKAAAARKRAAQ